MRKIPAATIALAAMAVPLSAPASADTPRPDQVVNGMYNMHFTDGSLEDLKFNATSCGVACTQVSFANVSGQAQFYSDRWHVSFPIIPTAWRCADGSAHPGFDQGAWFAATGVGSLEVVRTEAACGYPSHASDPIAHPFTLTRLTGQSGQPSVLPPVAF